MPPLRVLWDLFVGFGRATLLGYGGGPSIIPLYEMEAVDTYRWVTKEEFANALAFGNTLPGPIATKLTAYIGYRVAGVPGALVALAAVVLPTAILMIALFAVLYKFREHTVVKGIVKAARPVVFVMLASLAADYAQYAFSGTWAAFALAALFFVAVRYFGVHPGLAVAAALVLGILIEYAAPRAL